MAAYAAAAAAPARTAATPSTGFGGDWTARWITAAGAPSFDYGVYHFRRAFDLAAVPTFFRIHVSADNRYQLFVNGRRVAWGPARGDLYHWRYETVDLTPALRSGRNVLAAVVWNFGALAPEAQITNQTGFVLQGDGPAEQGLVDTGPGWKAAPDPAYEPLPLDPAEIRHQYYVAGPGERVTAARHPWGWEQPEFDDSAWSQARAGERAASREAFNAPSRWMMVPRSVPPMEERPERLSRVRESAGLEPPEGFPREARPFTVPPRTKVRLLLDQDHLTTAYPELVVSGGAGGTVTLRYAENLWIPGTGDKGHRDEVAGKEFRGYRDVFVADGGRGRLFRPLWWRTWRYLELTAETAGEPLTVEDLRGVYTGYPFQRRARFDSGRPELDRILDVGWRTARLCAHETYMDCPYYEQLQYVGDARIQALVSYYMTGDARLAKNAIELIDASRTPDGLTLSRSPTRLPQYIPGFSLWWIGMVHDFWRYQDDPAFVREQLAGVRAVLASFGARQRANGSLGPLPWWNFLDWADPWPAGVPPGWNQVKDWSSQRPSGPPPTDPTGASAGADLQLLLAYRWAADLERALGSPAVADENASAARRLETAVRELYWDGARGLFADTPARKDFSQQANALAVLAGVVHGEEARALALRMLQDASLTRASIYFLHYVHSALSQVGEGDRYLDLLGPWRTMMDLGLTTWAEKLDPSRSECHAWGSSPNVELFRTVLGIDAAAPGFGRVSVRPHLGPLERVSGAIPHPRGEVAVRLERSGSRLSAEVSLPEGVDGELVWRGQRRALLPGANRLAF